MSIYYVTGTLCCVPIELAGSCWYCTGYIIPIFEGIFALIERASGCLRFVLPGVSSLVPSGFRPVAGGVRREAELLLDRSGID